MTAMQRRILGPAVIWFLLASVMVWVIIRYGAGPVTAVSGVVLALVTAAPFAPAVRRWWLWSGEASTPSQIDDAALVLRETVRKQWTEEAGRRHQFAEEDRMAVRWEVVSRPAPRAGAENLLPDNGSLEMLLEAYEARPWPMIVVGDAGSGKTGLCVLLTLELAKKEAQQRIPVLFQLASWNPAENFERWLLGRLNEDYPFLNDEARWGATAAQDLLTGERLLPILDGFDELSEEARSAVMRTVRESPVFVSPFVLTSRTAEFADAAGKRTVSGKTVVRLLPIDDAAMGTYLREVFSTDIDRWLPVLDEIERRPDGLVATTLAKPLMLFLARTTYEGPDRSPADLLDQHRFGTADQLEHHLLDSFVPTVFARRSRPLVHNPARPSGHWGPRQAERTLTFLARHLSSGRKEGDRGTTDLSWWQLYRLVPMTVFVLTPVILGAAGCGLLGWSVFSLFGRPVFGLVFGLSIGLLGGFALGVIRPEPPMRFVPRAPRWNAAGRRSLLQDLGFGVTGAAAGGLIAGTLATPVHGLISGLIFGLTFAMVRRFTRPTEPKSAVTPLGVLRSDRAAVGYGVAVGGFAGLVVGVAGSIAVPELAAQLAFRMNPVQQSLFGGFVGMVLGGGGLGMMVLASSAWGHFVTARIWLFVIGATPLRLMRFLDDAHKLGVLRLTGPHYQFRHGLLQDRLSGG